MKFPKLFRFKNEPANKVPESRLTGPYNRFMSNPHFRKTIIDCSIQEDEENCFYNGILNTIAEHCVGSVPLVIGAHSVNAVNDIFEDRWLSWTQANGIGSVIRQIRRSAARTGLGIALPYINEQSPDKVKLAYKTIQLTDLENPKQAGPEDRIYNGIEYDQNWNISKIYVRNEGTDPTPYDIENIIVWGKQIKEGLICYGPECGPAFTLYPSVKRYMESIVKGEEFRSSMPMAMELDPAVWGKENVDGQDVPVGKYEYEPGVIPTLPPGVKLSGMPISISGQERTQFIELVIGAAARCVQMPKNLALGDSSKHNMASSQFDMQPWINRVKIDRCDYEPVTRKIFSKWKNRAVLTAGYLPVLARKEADNFVYSLNYDSIFQHPDPNKNASARATDLISGTTTLTRVYKDMGQNARRELDREAQLYGITREEYMQILLAARTPDTLKILGLINEQNQEEDFSTQDRG